MKKKLLMMALASMVVLTGCVDGEEKGIEKETLEYAKSDDDENNLKSFDDIVASVDFSKPHVQVELKDKLVVDADIPTYVPASMGVYQYSDVLEIDEDSKKQLESSKESEVVRLIDEYFGEDVTLTITEAREKEVLEGKVEGTYYSNVSSSLGYINFTNGSRDEYNDYMIGSTLEDYFPQVDSEYDEAMIEAKIDGFINHFASVLPRDISSEYRCIHFDEVFWKTSGQDMDAYFSDWSIQDKDYYWIRLYSEIEDDVYYNDGYNNIALDKIGETSWPRAFLEIDGGKKLKNYYLESYVDIYVDENGELFAFEIADYIETGECAEVVEIISVEDALEAVYNLYAKNPVYQQITINEVKLTYAAVPGETVDENGYRAAYLKPIWVVHFLKDNGEEICNVIIVDAHTGEVIYRVI